MPRRNASSLPAPSIAPSGIHDREMTDDSIRNAGSFRSGRIVPGPWPPRQGLRSAGRQEIRGRANRRPPSLERDVEDVSRCKGTGSVEGQPPRFVGGERDLRARLTAGDPRALAEAYAQFSPMVYGLAARVTGDRAAAEDVTQEVLLHLWERPWVLDPDRGRLRAWLATMAHHRSVDLLRRAEVRDRHATPAAPP